MHTINTVQIRKKEIVSFALGLPIYYTEIVKWREKFQHLISNTLEKFERNGFRTCGNTVENIKIVLNNFQHLINNLLFS